MQKFAPETGAVRRSMREGKNKLGCNPQEGESERASERARELGMDAWHGILFEEPNPNREPPTRPNWALEDDDTGNPTPPNTQGRARGTRKTQPAERSSWGGGEGQQGLHCGEANPNRWREKGKKEEEKKHDDIADF